jgi:hypothetical protein
MMGSINSEHLPENFPKEEEVNSKEDKVLCETPTPGKKPTRSAAEAGVMQQANDHGGNDMLRKSVLRWGGLLPLAGLLVWIVLTPLMATIWNFPIYNLDAIWQRTPFIVRSVGQYLVEQGIDLNSESVYFRVGRYFFLIYLSMTVGLYAFHNRVKSEIRAIPNSVSISYRLLLISLSIVAISDFISYGLGVFSDFLWSFGFAVESLVFLIVLLGSIWYGAALIRAKIGLSTSGGLLIAASLLAPVLVFEDIFIGYLPNGPVLPYIVAWSVIGLQTTFRTPITSIAKGS